MLTMEKNKKKSWKETIRLNRRGLSYFCRSCPQILLSQTLYGIWTALAPYVGIYFSAQVIQELAGQRDPQRLGFWVLLTLGSAAGIALVSALLKKWKETQDAGTWFQMERFLTEKILKTDYVNLDETENADLLYTIRQNKNTGGWGFYRVLNDFVESCSALVSILGGISLTVTLFLLPVPEQASAYTWLNSPWVVLLVVALMLGITLLAPIFANQAESYWAKHADLLRLSNRLFSFFGFLGYNRELAADVRTYEQDCICEKYNRNKEDAFNSRGVFSRYAKGSVLRGGGADKNRGKNSAPGAV